MSSRLYGSLRAVKVLLALLRSTLTVLASPGREARIDSRGAADPASFAIFAQLKASGDYCRTLGVA